VNVIAHYRPTADNEYHRSQSLTAAIAPYITTLQHYSVIASSTKNIFQNFCGASGVPFVMIYMLYSFENGPLEPKQYKIQQMATFQLPR